MFFGNKRIVVIGGSSGIGLATAMMAAQQDAEVVIASLDAGKLDRARAEIGGRTEAYPLDVRDEARVQEFFKKLGSFDHLTTPGSSAVGGPFLTTETARARAYYMLQTPEPYRRLRILIDRTLALLFRADIVNFDLSGEERVLHWIGERIGRPEPTSAH
jgi:NAD(P)-dependent dehydrogenase (short-subunit alcohol dehydrogenase family)